MRANQPRGCHRVVYISAHCRWVVQAAFGVALLWLCYPAEALAASVVGSVNNVLLTAYGTAPAGSRSELDRGQEVVAKEIVETTDGAALHIEFLDGSDFHLGSSSRATMDSFLFDPESQDGQMALLLKEGIFRFKTGLMKSSGIRVVTPVAVITPTGTEFIVQVLATGEMVVSVIAGAVTITPIAATIEPISISAPETARVLTNGLFHGGVEPPPFEEAMEFLVRWHDLETGEPLVTSAGPAENAGTTDPKESRAEAGLDGEPDGESPDGNDDPSGDGDPGGNSRDRGDPSDRGADADGNSNGGNGGDGGDGGDGDGDGDGGDGDNGGDDD